MGQPGFFDVDRRLEAISAKGDPLETIKTTVPWEEFRAPIEVAIQSDPAERKSAAGRPGYDTILKFKMVVLQALYNLSDEQLEIQVRDRLSFMRFLDLGLHDRVPDAGNTGRTVWAHSAYRSAEIEAKLAAKGSKSRVHLKGVHGRPLSEREKATNTARSEVRARFEHIFGHQANSMGAKIVRTVGAARARIKIGMMNLGYNMRRLVQLERMAAASA